MASVPEIVPERNRSWLIIKAVATFLLPPETETIIIHRHHYVLISNKTIGGTDGRSPNVNA